jgi:hypothetical protein
VLLATSHSIPTVHTQLTSGAGSMGPLVVFSLIPPHELNKSDLNRFMFEVFATVSVKITLSFDVTPCSPVDVNRRL